ncbi:MAG: aldehyde-activating protein [Gammaproteobacteria bacterium]|nr:aldehyde-activating protein [Gammaproteobacteria bacterium]
MNLYYGACSCGKVKLEFHSMLKLSIFAERRCDCDFCSARKIGYLSEPHGNLTIINQKPLKSYQQGSKQADFLACPDCDDVICASYQSDKQSKGLIGSLNAKLLDEYLLLGSSETVSPKKLIVDDKLERWKQIWMPIEIIKKPA